MTPPGGHFSPSSINTFLRCERQYFYSYIEGIKIPPGWAAVKGSAIDRACQLDMTAKIEKGHNLSASSLYEIVVKEVEERVNEINPFDPEVEEAGGAEKIVSSFIEDTPKVIEAYQPWAATYEPTGVQKEVRADVGGYPMLGYIDVRDNRRISDLKMAGKRKTDTAGEVSNQLRLYQIIESRNGEPAQEAELFSIYPLTKGYKSQVLKQSKNEEAEKRLEDTVHLIGKQVELGLFKPVNLDGGNGWVCSQKWCGYFASTCPYGQKARVQV